MKRYGLKFMTMIACFGLMSLTAMAQFDDIYFDPEEDEVYVDSYVADDGDVYVTENYYYDDDEYDYYEEDAYDRDYYYSSRIRRFRRPFVSMGFYDPFFYDPFYFGSSLAFSYGPYWGFNSWSRWNRWNRFNRWNRWNNWGYNSWAYNSWGFNSWNRGFYDPFWGGGFGRASYLDCVFGFNSFNRFGGGGLYTVNNFYGSAYDGIQPVYGNRGTYYGARRGGAVKASPGSPKISPRAADRLVGSGTTVSRTPGRVANTRTTTAGIGRSSSRDISAVGTRTYRTPRTISNSGSTVRKPISTTKSYDNTRKSTRSYTPSNSRVTRTPARTSNTRTYKPSTRTKTYTPSRRSYSPSKSGSRSYSPSRSGSSRSYSPSKSGRSRSYSPSRSGSSRSYSPSRSGSSRSYSPSRSSGSSRSYSPSRSSGSSRSYSPSSRSSSPRSSGSSRSSSPRRN